MPRRKKRWWKPNINTKSLQSVIALLSILLGVILLITFIGTLAGMNNILQESVFALFGLASILIPINFLLLGIALSQIKTGLSEPRLLWGMLLMTISFSVFAASFSDRGGGLFGVTVASQLSEFITPIGTFFTGIVFVVIALLILLNASIEEVITTMGEHVTVLNHILAKLKFNKGQADGVMAEHSHEEAAVAALKINSSRQVDIEIMDDEVEALPRQTVSVPKAPVSNQNGEISTAPMPNIPYQPPPLSLLANPQQVSTDMTSIERNAQVIEKTLDNFGIQARIAEVNLGPSVTQYAIELAEGTRSSKITGLQNDLALALASPTGSVRVEAPIPGKRLIGIEVPNEKLAMVTLKAMLQSKEMKEHPSKLAVALGEDVSGKPVIADIAKWPHILIAGATGAGKSALIHSIIFSILYRAKPEEVSFVMVDPKRVELTAYNTIPHLQTPVIVDPDKTVNAFKWAVDEMERRYKLFQQLSARNLADFNEKTDTEKLPYIIMIVDELADLMVFAANDMEIFITRIAQKARATGIFMILSTQRPSVDVITGLIKANIPARIALTVTSSTDSRVILDSIGAEKLLGKGDMLYLPSDAGKSRRVQGVFVSDEELHSVTEYMKQFQSPYNARTAGYSSTDSQEEDTGTISVKDGITSYNPPDDNKFNEAVEIILNHDKASASLLQRRLSIGYARAARLLDELQERGIVGEQDGSNPREVNREAALEFITKLQNGNS